MALVMLLTLWFFSGLVEIQYVTNRPGVGIMVSIEGATVKYLEWAQSPPHPQDQFKRQRDDTGLSFHRGPWLIELLGSSQPESSPFDEFAFGQPTVHRQFSFVPAVLVLFAMSFVLARRPRPHPLGHCAECGYNLTGNTSGVCSECGACNAVPDASKTA